MKITKKLISLALAVMLLLSLAAPAIAADSDFVIDEDGALTEYHGTGGDVVIPDGVTGIGNEVFKGNTSLKSVTIPASVAVIGWNAFEGCTGLANVIIPEGVTDIYNSAFAGCTSLKSVTIPASVEMIAPNAFGGCTGLESVIITSGDIFINGYAFDACPSLTDVYFGGTQKRWEAIERENSDWKMGSIFGDGAKQPTIHYDFNGTAVDSDFVIKNGVLTSYRGTDGDIVIPDSVTKIGDGAFAASKYLTSIVIPSSVTEIGERVFLNCQKLTSVTLPSSITRIAPQTFMECMNLPSISIPSSVTEIGDGAFSTCSRLTSIDIPSSVTKIGESAFGGCGFSSFTVPSSITEISNSMLFGCGNLTDVIIPSSITRIGENAFGYCKNLSSINIPSSVTEIDLNAFYGSDLLTDIYYGGTEEQWAAIDFPGELSSLLVVNPLPTATIHYNSVMPEQPAAATPSFSDVPAGAWYADAVKWAVEKKITAGTSATSFAPETTCTTAQILTFLWRANGEPSVGGIDLDNVAYSAYYYRPVIWAMSKGMVSRDTLSPDEPCTRASTVMFMWQAAGSPTVSTKLSFTDVPADADYAMAVAWAVENGVTAGTSATTFSPDDTCTRGHIVTFLNRAFA